MKMLILRPTVGAEATAARARALGHDGIVAPLFQYRALGWTAPAVRPDAVLMTSAAAARLGGPGLATYHPLPLQAVGQATATAARAAGFGTIIAGDSDMQAALAALADRGACHVLHLAGRDHVAATDPRLRIHHVAVYAADAIPVLTDAMGAALDTGAIVLLHSARAARVFSNRVDEAGMARSGIRIAGFSRAVVDAAGPGWSATAIARHPTDDALFAAAAMLCDQDAIDRWSHDDERMG